MTEETDPRAKSLADACRRLVEGGADTQTAYDTVMAEDRGRQIAARLNTQRGQNQTPKTEEPKKP